MKWSFEIIETSNGVYKFTGRSNTGNIVSIQCGEEGFFRVFRQAFELEIELGTLPSKALFDVCQVQN